MSETETHPVTYSRHWAFLLVLMAAAGGVFYLRSNWISPTYPTQASHQQTVPHVKQGANWFLILKMPEVTKGFPAADAQIKFEAWINALLNHGYHPLLLSDIFRRLERGEALPARTVVLSFDPGYLQTFKTLSPILIKHGLPALWVTSKGALNRADMRYVSFHQAGLMEKSGAWDVAFKNSTGGLWFLKKGWPRTFDTANTALNRGGVNRTLHRLSVNASWSNEEFVDRLEAEDPVVGPATLSARQIQDRVWGVAAVPGSLPFDFATPPDKRSAHLSWLGSAGLQNFELQFSADHIDGELWLSLRSDPSVSESVKVGFTPEAWVVEEHTQETDTVLGFFPWTQPRTGPVSATITITGNTVKATVNGEKPFSYETLAKNTSSNAVIELDLYDKVRGVAQTKGIHLNVRPIQ